MNCPECRRELYPGEELDNCLVCREDMCMDCNNDHECIDIVGMNHKDQEAYNDQ